MAALKVDRGSFAGSPKNRRQAFHFLSLRALSIALLCGLSITMVSCQAPLVAIRHENAQRVLTAFRARPIAVANQGRTDLTLHDCRRLVLSNSLDLHTALWDEQVKARTAQSTLPAILPKIEGRYEYSQRDTIPWGRSDVINQEGAFEAVGPGPGTGVTNWSSGKNRAWSRGQIEMKWSPMDSAMALYLSRVKSNEADYARYQRARVAQQLIGSASSAFYRLLALQEAVSKAKVMVAKTREVAKDLENVKERGRVRDLDRLREKDYRENLSNSEAVLSDSNEKLSHLYVSMARQRDLLASNMNVCPDDCFRVVGTLYPIPKCDLQPCKLESAALVNRPEAYQADLNFINSLDQHKRSIVKLFPKAEGFLGEYWDATKFMYHNAWTDGGLRVTWDFMQFTGDLLSCQAAKENIIKTDKQRALISMGILSQVRAKTLDAIAAYDHYKKTSEREEQEREAYRIAETLDKRRSDAETPKYARHVSARLQHCKLLQAEIDKIIAAGELHAALSELYAAVGTNFPVTSAHPPARPTMVDRIIHLPKSALGTAACALKDFIR